MKFAIASDRRTAADAVYDSLYEQIVSLDLMPGEKMSEADVADRFGVSRQPVRDAFNRLGNLNLLLIQPQRATVVRNFSIAAIQSARFIRLAVELEVFRVAAQNWTPDLAPEFDRMLDEQQACADAGDGRRFHMLDANFHERIAEVAQAPFAYDLIREKKAQVDRICVLSLKGPHEMVELVADHRAIVDALSRHDAADAEAALRLHLSRIDRTIAAIRRDHAEYFDD
ncbi:GntR family transcriptional regulator [Jannaschia pohangensis]|uniref:Transcriptional regulator, GntR family n=1 Tax=Jannaschia pohangensis TaxID=390807 RepID=A0A1I3HH69_9RHOB|nr:GntR family transcriptional regulator [Jannaschia pohangensis]SFI34981.1 transcriptional regulator, GntR family [Jannaschia pohangensis]